MKLSVLDTMLLRSDQSSADAIAATVALAQCADEAGYERYWVSEHHGGPLASTTPPVAVSTIAARTERIRVGSGGVMLPNHTAFDVAEQFSFLEAAYPGRIDLGLGRAPGGRAIAIYALRDGAAANPASFPHQVESIQAMVQPEGATVHVQGSTYTLKATPEARTTPTVWILGSSTESARLAGERGLPYAYAHHFSGTGTDEAVDVYRSRFRPSEHAERPRVLLTMNAVIAPTEDDARRLALPYALALLSMQTNGSMQRQPLVEDAETQALSGELKAFSTQLMAPWVVGTAAQGRAQISAFARRHDVDEVMIHPVAGAFTGTAADRSPQREATLRLLSVEEGHSSQEVPGEGASGGSPAVAAR
ncbi:MsnO8 family LLM class oxidoreductase [Streptomyces fuscichromogenes]|uniref:Alkanal monooxygenase subunit alpha n=1 Tax=Streptomyces fuscichromogenes TaxID=1324013 RepID=A0A918CTL7_9ACTN|nr:MsnO8 family LLM class oxidoreductase [Streptomyces fuscichromogenes]GGN23295.1 alkanal monooxygenase subunit alpha [Streptomyces fuscichromogenes]